MGNGFRVKYIEWIERGDMGRVCACHVCYQVKGGGNKNGGMQAGM